MHNEKEITIGMFWHFGDYYECFLSIPKDLRCSDERVIVNDRNIGKSFVTTGKRIGELMEYYRLLLKGGGRINVDINKHKIIEKWTRGNP